MNDSGGPSLNTPVVLLVFSRPEQTRRVLEQVRLARPSVLLVVADGPRLDRPGEVQACAAVRRLVEEMVDWHPRLLTNYAEKNMGLRQRVSSGLTWAFEQVDRAIILEDDCVPHPGFFRFCGKLLDLYEHDSRVGVISGGNFQPAEFTCAESYYFSRYNHCWGWATWRRAWKLFDAQMQNWPLLRDSKWLEGVFPDPGHANYWSGIFEKVHRRQIDSWAYAWTFSCWSQSLLTVIPGRNLVSNIGFGEGSTHTTDASSPWSNLPAPGLEFPLRHPVCVSRNHDADDYTQRFVVEGSAQKGWRFPGFRMIAKILGK